MLEVEDNPSNQLLVERILAGRRERILAGRRDLDLITTSEGRRAPDLARRHRPGVVPLDLHLPDCDGHEVLERRRADPGTAQRSPVVSADANAGQIERLLAAGAGPTSQNPLDVAQVLTVLDESLGGPRP